MRASFLTVAAILVEVPEALDRHRAHEAFGVRFSPDDASGSFAALEQKLEVAEQAVAHTTPLAFSYLGGEQEQRAPTAEEMRHFKKKKPMSREAPEPAAAEPLVESLVESASEELELAEELAAAKPEKYTSKTGISRDHGPSFSELERKMDAEKAEAKAFTSKTGISRDHGPESFAELEQTMDIVATKAGAEIEAIKEEAAEEAAAAAARFSSETGTARGQSFVALEAALEDASAGPGPAREGAAALEQALEPEVSTGARVEEEEAAEGAPDRTSLRKRHPVSREGLQAERMSLVDYVAYAVGATGRRDADALSAIQPGGPGARKARPSVVDVQVTGRGEADVTAY